MRPATCRAEAPAPLEKKTIFGRTLAQAKGIIYRSAVGPAGIDREVLREALVTSGRLSP